MANLKCPAWSRTALIEGLPPADQIPDKFWQREGVNRLKYVDLTGTRQATQRFSRVATRAIALLERHGIEVGRILNRGRYAEVSNLLDHPDIIVKVSGDVTEAAAWAYLLEMVDQGALSWDELPALPRVHCVYQVPARTKSERPLYVIFVDRCYPLSRSEKLLVEAIDNIMLTGKKGYRPGIRAPYTAERAVQKITRRYRSLERSLEYATSMVETLQTLASHSLFVYDIHSENVMKDRKGDMAGQWKITDLGMTETCCPVSVPILEAP